MLHKPTVRLQDTTNDVLIRFHSNSPVAETVTGQKSAPVQQRRAA
jgi:hypothetical protein